MKPNIYQLNRQNTYTLLLRTRSTGRKRATLKILHVLTLMGANGEYGGPVRVARELSSMANSIDGFDSKIIGGTNISESSITPNENFVPVRKWINTTSVSGFFSLRFAIIF